MDRLLPAQDEHGARAINVAHEVDEFETDAAMFEGLATLLRTVWRIPGGSRGTVKVSVRQHPKQVFVACFGDELLIERHDRERMTGTQVTIPIATIRRIFRELECRDWRGPEFTGTITFKGNLGYASHVAKGCLRRSDWTKARFGRAARLLGSFHSRQLRGAAKALRAERRFQRRATRVSTLVRFGFRPAPVRDPDASFRQCDVPNGRDPSMRRCRELRTTQLPNDHASARFPPRPH